MIFTLSVLLVHVDLTVERRLAIPVLTYTCTTGDINKVRTSFPLFSISLQRRPKCVGFLRESGTRNRIHSTTKLAATNTMYWHNQLRADDWPQTLTDGNFTRTTYICGAWFWRQRYIAGALFSNWFQMCSSEVHLDCPESGNYSKLFSGF